MAATGFQDHRHVIHRYQWENVAYQGRYQQLILSTDHLTQEQVFDVVYAALQGGRQKNLPDQKSGASVHEHLPHLKPKAEHLEAWYTQGLQEAL